jgi:hypothetical protein
MGFISKSQVLLDVLFNHLMRNTKILIIYNRWVSPDVKNLSNENSQSTSTVAK